MKRIHAYRALLVKDRPEDTSLGVVFPELAGCVSAGDSPEHAWRLAQEALALHLSGLVIDGEALPAPALLDAPLPDWLASDGPLLEVGRAMLRVSVAVEAAPA